MSLGRCDEHDTVWVTGHGLGCRGCFEKALHEAAIVAERLRVRVEAAEAQIEELEHEAQSER